MSSFQSPFQTGSFSTLFLDECLGCFLHFFDSPITSDWKVLKKFERKVEKNQSCFKVSKEFN